MSAKPVQPEGLVGSIQSEVADEASPLLLFLIKYARVIAVLVALCIAAIVGYWIYASHNDGRRQEAAREVGPLLVISDPAMRLEKLEAYAVSAPEYVRPTVAFAIMEAAAQLRDNDKIYKAWERIGAMDGSMSAPAAMGMAGALARQGKHKEALNLLNGTVKNLDGMNRVSVNLRIVLLAELLGENDRALAALDSLLARPESGADMLEAAERTIWTQKRDELTRRASTESPDQAGGSAESPVPATAQ